MKKPPILFGKLQFLNVRCLIKLIIPDI